MRFGGKQMESSRRSGIIQKGEDKWIFRGGGDAVRNCVASLSRCQIFVPSGKVNFSFTRRISIVLFPTDTEITDDHFRR